MHVQNANGFTLIELMLVVAVIGILAAISVPAYSDYTTRARISEGIQLATAIEQDVSAYYDRWGTMPKDNAAAGLPARDAIKGRSVESVEVRNGVIEIQFDNTVRRQDAGGALLFNPAVNDLYPTGPLRWYCGEAAPAKGFSMATSSGMTTSIPDRWLPTACRSSK